MEVENFSGTSYKGTKDFTQHDITMANATGFGAPADDYMERGIDLNEQLVQNKPATFFMQVCGESMCDAGINDGDIVIVDRSLKPQSGKIIIAAIDGEMLIRRYMTTFNTITLLPETSRIAPLPITPYHDFKIWGVVTYAIKHV